MSDYLFLANVGEGIVNSVSLSNFVPNREKNSSGKVEYKVGVYTQKFDSIIWEKLDERSFIDNNLVISSDDYNLVVGQLVVVVPCSLDTKLDDQYKELPRPLTRKSDNSPVNERSTVMFTKGESFSSYQGEFPYQISKIKGTFLAFDPLLNTGKNVNNKVVFINIHSKSISHKDECRLSLADSNTNQLVERVSYVQNSACILNLSDVNKDLVFYSKDTLGIPIFIAHDNQSIFSVEHTHPPSEFFWNSKINGQQIMKQSWFSKLP